MKIDQSIKLSVKSEVGGDDQIFVLNLKQLFVCNIFDNYILLLDFNFPTFGVIFLYIRRLLPFLNLPSFEKKFNAFVIHPLGTEFFTVYVEY